MIDRGRPAVRPPETRLPPAPAAAPARGIGALGGSLLFHAALAAVLLGFWQVRTEEPVAPRRIATVVLPPLEPAPVPRAAPPPRPPVEVRPQPPAVPPRARAPEHDLPDAATSAPAAEPEHAQPEATERSSEPPAAAPVPRRAPPAPAPSEAELMETEARRLFGSRNRAASPEAGPLAAAGLPAYLPENPDRCGPLPARDTAGGRLAELHGRVYRERSTLPLAGAHLQIIGTPYVAFSDGAGRYTLRFDPALVDHCRTQYVRVTAPGFRSRLLVLSLGPQSANDVHLTRN